MANSGGLQGQMLVISTLATLRETRERGLAHTTLKMETFLPGPGSVASRRGRDIRHSQMVTCSMERGKMEDDMESSYSCFLMVPDIKLLTSMVPDKEDGIRLTLCRIIQNSLFHKRVKTDSENSDFGIKLGYHKIKVSRLF